MKNMNNDVSKTQGDLRSSQASLANATSKPCYFSLYGKFI